MGSLNLVRIESDLFIVLEDHLLWILSVERVVVEIRPIQNIEELFIYLDVKSAISLISADECLGWNFLINRFLGRFWYFLIFWILYLISFDLLNKLQVKFCLQLACLGNLNRLHLIFILGCLNRLWFNQSSLSLKSAHIFCSSLFLHLIVIGMIYMV